MSTWVQTFTAFPGVWSERSYDRFRPQPFKKAAPEDFTNWLQNHSLRKRHIVPLISAPRWAKYFDHKDKALKKLDIGYKIINIDVKSVHAGNIYNDDDKCIIYQKLACSLIGRPLHLVVKTFYHLSLIGVAKSIFMGIKKHQPIKEIAQRTIRSLMDIIRTPIYEIAMIIIAVAALVIAPFNTTFLYDARAFTGQLSHELYWGKRYDIPIDLNPCMRRLYNIMDEGKKDTSRKLL